MEYVFIYSENRIKKLSKNKIYKILKPFENRSEVKAILKSIEKGSPTPIIIELFKKFLMGMVLKNGPNIIKKLI